MTNLYQAALADLAGVFDRIDDAAVDRHRQVVSAFDLATALPAGARSEELLRFMARDKKSRGDLTFVLDGPRGVEVVRGVDQDDVMATLAEMEHRETGAPA